ncbi:Uma2 family endonuclease [Lyngbya sp. CCY1209]|uniref:Uma2 family endonuclease n=1 Tax=Lyngbya sp. CCY1209 TaxID=2886103 RepID=UPI002D2033A1|nr:Uma2 family endonuclease [Lyngbya sp. CCY1209]MEB3886345.1 Uma2 family endonuclease [Lyngbya sp. CCY1209]
MVAVNPAVTKVSLEDFLKLPETKPYSEYLDGEIAQKPMPQGEHSIIQTYLSARINDIGKANKGALAFTELRCTFGGRSLVPDISVFAWERIPKTEQGRIQNRFEVCPDWVIEILSPEQSANQVIKKIIFSLKQGTELGWLIDPKDESVMIFQLNQLPDIPSKQEFLPVLESVKEMQLSTTEIFNWLKIE